MFNVMCRGCAGKRFVDVPRRYAWWRYEEPAEKLTCPDCLGSGTVPWDEYYESVDEARRREDLV